MYLPISSISLLPYSLHVRARSHGQCFFGKFGSSKRKYAGVNWSMWQSLIDKYLWKRWAKFSELSYICSCKQRSLTNTFDNISHYRHGKCDKSLLVCCHLCKMFAWEIFIVVSFVWTQQQRKYFNKDCLT